MIILRQKSYSKPDSEKSMTLGHIGNKVKFKDMTEKQLKNIAGYEEAMKEKHSTKKGRKDTAVRDTIGAASFVGLGGVIGNSIGKIKSKKIIEGVPEVSKWSKIYAPGLDNTALKLGADQIAKKKILKSTSIGALAGLSTYALMKIAADKNHKRNASLAKKELERRGIKDLGSTKSLKKRNKEVLNDLKKK